MAETETGTPTEGTPRLAEEIKKKAVSRFGFWTTVWWPFASYLWWIGAKVAKLHLSGIQKGVMIFFCIFWPLLIAFMIAVMATYICHGGLDAWFARQAIKVATLSAGTFDWCDNIPDPGIDW